VALPVLGERYRRFDLRETTEKAGSTQTALSDGGFTAITLAIVVDGIRDNGYSPRLAIGDVAEARVFLSAHLLKCEVMLVEKCRFEQLAVNGDHAEDPSELSGRRSWPVLRKCMRRTNVRALRIELHARAHCDIGIGLDCFLSQ